MRVIFAGTPETAVPSLRELHASNHEIVGVLSRPAAHKGRGRLLESSAVATEAERLDLRLLTPSTLRDGQFIEQIEALNPQCCAVVAYGQMISPELLQIPQHGWVNLHFSLLPAWRGAAPVQHAILHGDDITGATTFALDTGMDTGPTYGFVTEQIRGSDTAGELLARLSRSGAALLVETLDGIIDGSIERVVQAADGISYAPKLGVNDARIDWSLSALHVNRLIRACAPSPGAWTMFSGSRLKVLASTVLADKTMPVAKVVADRNEVLVGCGMSVLRLEQIQPEGKRAMAAVEWARGVRIGEVVMFH